MSVKKIGLLLLLYYLCLLFGELHLLSFKMLCLSLDHLLLMVYVLFAGIILLFVQMIFSKTSKQHIKQSSLAGLTVGFFLCVGYVLQTFGLLYTTSSKAGFLTGLSIVMVPILSFIFLKQKATIFIVIGIAVATAGLYLLTAGDSFQLNIGDILVLGCAVAFAAHILVNGFFSKNITFIVTHRKY